MRVERVAFEWLRRFYRQPRYPEPMKTSGRGRYKFSPEEGRSLLRIVRLMRQAAVMLTLTGIFTAIHAVHAAVTVKWTEFTSIFSVIDDVTISYYLLICASAFLAIAGPGCAAPPAAELPQKVSVADLLPAGVKHSFATHVKSRH